MPSEPELVGTGTWPRVRAGLIALTLAVHTCAAMPMPRPIKAEDARTATAAEELKLWLDVLAGVGISATSDQLLDLVNTVGGACSTFKKGVLAPFQPLLRITGTGQSWALFAVPDRYPNRLVVEVRRPSGEWEMLFRSADPEHTFLAPQLAFRRIRGVYDTASSRGSPGKVYDRFVDWVARQTLAAEPNATDVRIKMVQFHVSLPDDEPDGAEGGANARNDEEKTRLVRLRSRDQVER